MSFSDEIMIIRQKSFLTQTEFAAKINVAYNTVNRWKTGKSRPNILKRRESSMKKHFTKLISLMLAFVMLLTSAPMIKLSASAASSTLIGENASYVYGAESDIVKISNYTAADLSAAMALLEVSEDLKALLNSGYGTEASPFVVKNFKQLRLVFFWMNFSKCPTGFMFVADNKTVKPKDYWSKLVSGCGRNAADYNLTSSVYVKLGDDITATVEDKDCTSIFEDAILRGKDGEEYRRYLTLLTDATLHLNSASRNLDITLAGSNRDMAEALMSGTNGATLHLYDNTHWGSFTLRSKVRFKSQAYFSKMSDYSPPFYFANFSNINAEYISVTSVPSTGTSSFLFRGVNGTFDHCTFSYGRHTSSVKNGMEASINGSAFLFTGKVELLYDVLSCTSPDAGKYTVHSNNIIIEKTDLPEGITASRAAKVQVNRTKIGGDVFLFFAGEGDIDLSFCDITGYIKLIAPPTVPKTKADVNIDHCTAQYYQDSTYCENVRISNSQFRSGNVTNELNGRNVTVNSCLFWTSVAGGGAVKVGGVSVKEFSSFLCQNTQIVNNANGHAVVLPEIYGYKTAKNEFGEEYVVSHPTADKNVVFKGCSFSLKFSRSAGTTYIYQDTTHLDLADSTDAAGLFVGLNMVTRGNPNGKVYYTDMSGKLMNCKVSALTKNITDIAEGKNQIYHFACADMFTKFGDSLTGMKQADNFAVLYIDAGGDTQYTLTYNANGGTMLYTPAVDTYYANTAVPVLYGEENLLRNGYVFNGWSTDPNASAGEYQRGDKITLTKDTTLYAIYSKQVNVTYDFNGGKNADTGSEKETLTLLAGVKISINRNSSTGGALFAPEKKDRAFLGWSTKKTAATAEYKDGASFTVGSENITLYAVWTTDTTTFRVVFKNADGGTFTAYTQYYNTSFTVPNGCAAPDGKRFVKWYDTTNKAYYLPGDKYVVGKANAELTPVFENIPDGEIQHVITAANINGVQTPTEDVLCVTDGDLKCNADYTAAYCGGKSTWYYKDNKGYTITVNSADKFIANMFYTVNINVTPTADNYSFSRDTVFTINNDTPAKVVAVSDKTYTIAATFKCEEADVIRDVAITNLVLPLGGENASTSVKVSSTSGKASFREINWYNGSTKVSSFVAGKTYRAEITVRSLYLATKFAEKLNVTVNGSQAAVKEVKYNSDGTITVVLNDMSADKTAISNCVVTGVPQPYADCEPEKVTLECATNQYSAKIVFWEMMPTSGRSYQIYEGSTRKTFASGTARAYVSVTPVAGYSLSSDPTVWINGKKAVKDGSSYYIDLTVKESEKITSFFLTGVPTFTAGETIDFNPLLETETPHTKVEINTYPVEIYTSSGDKTVTPVWTVTNESSYTEKVLSPGAVAVKGGYYTLYVAVTHDTGYTWDENLRFNLSANNGLLAMYQVADFGNTRVFQIITRGQAGEVQKSIALTGFAQPTACTYTSILQSAVKTADGTILECQWLDENGSVFTGKFVAGKQYRLRLVILPTDYRTFDASTGVTMEGAFITTQNFTMEKSQGGCITIVTASYTAADHNYANVTLPNENATQAAKNLASNATCTSPAKYYYYCSCGAVSTTKTADYGDALGHDFTAKTVKSEAQKAAATCTSPAVYFCSCTRCGAIGNTATFTNGNAKGHTAGAAVKEKVVEATCKAAGSYDEVVYCSVCHAEMSRSTKTTAKLTTHTFDAGKVTKAATEKADGVKTYTCTVCGTTKTEAIPYKAPDEAPFMLGDVDLNKKITSADARLTLRASVGLEIYAKGTVQFKAADVDFDEKLTSADARLILRASVGLEDPENWGK